MKKLTNDPINVTNEMVEGLAYAFPRIVKKPKDEFAKNNPMVTPIKPSGMVASIIVGPRKELNCATKRNKIKKKATGNFFAIDDEASSDLLASPANVY